MLLLFGRVTGLEYAKIMILQIVTCLVLNIDLSTHLANQTQVRAPVHRYLLCFAVNITQDISHEFFAT